MSIHPALSVLASRPDLVIAHMTGYAALAKEEFTSVGIAMAWRAAAAAAGILLLTACLTLAGVAAMLGMTQPQFHWIFLAAPGALLALAAIALGAACRPLGGQGFAQLKAEISADAQMLRRATTDA